MRWADLARLPSPPHSLPDRIIQSAELYPCDVLFVHRDADDKPYATRIDEMRAACARAGESRGLPPIIPVVPVRMLEAWLLCDEAALRRAAGNPNGRQPLDLPRARDLESVLDPKTRLHELWREASALSTRRRHSLRVSVPRLAELTDDFSPLRRLPAFQALETEMRRTLREEGWT